MIGALTVIAGMAMALVLVLWHRVEKLVRNAQDWSWQRGDMLDRIEMMEERRNAD